MGAAATGSPALCLAAKAFRVALVHLRPGCVKNTRIHHHHHHPPRARGKNVKYGETQEHPDPFGLLGSSQQCASLRLGRRLSRLRKALVPLEEGTALPDGDLLLVVGQKYPPGCSNRFSGHFQGAWATHSPGECFCSTVSLSFFSRYWGKPSANPTHRGCSIAAKNTQVHDIIHT